MTQTYNEIQTQTQTGDHLAPYTVSTRSHVLLGSTSVTEGTLIGTQWKLASQLGVDLEYRDDVVIARYRIVDDYGYGRSQAEAIRSLLVSMLDYRESLERRRQQGRLSDELKDIHEVLKALIIATT